MTPTSPEAIAKRNIPLFIAFRIFFNARFYYPVFAVIFLDFGLTIEQFALLNVIWAITIIVAEVPSGALSDLIGRKKLLVLTAMLMVMEMLVWVFAPTGNTTVLFWVLALNRVLSGLGEASASGSDEALVFDSLEHAGMKDKWSQVLATSGRWQAVAFMCALGIGGAIYDVSVVQYISNLLGLEVAISKATILRWPIILNVATAILTLLVALRFVEPDDGGPRKTRPSIAAAFRQTWDAAKWIGRTPFALVVIVAGAFVDSVIRMFITMNSEYYRLIEFTPVAFGFIGMGIAGLGFFIAPLSKYLVDTFKPTSNFFIIAGIAFIGFYGSTFFIPYTGLVFAVLLFNAFSILMFCISYYLNHVTDRSRRATVLSFKGMALNLGYASIGWMYAMLGGYLRNSDAALANNEDLLFITSIGYFPWYFAVGIVGVVLFVLWKCPRPNQAFRAEGKEKRAAMD